MNLHLNILYGCLVAFSIGIAMMAWPLLTADRRTIVFRFTDETSK